MPKDASASLPAERLTTTLILPLSGLNFAGIDSHVLRPMITAFILVLLPLPVADVAFRK
jgi:hypothetical protein